jgi:hypothetical protein
VTAPPSLPASSVAPANGPGVFGLYPAQDFLISTGAHAGGATIRQALWYFRDETIGLPKPGLPVASFTRGVPAFEDVHRWASMRPRDAPIDYPPLVWVAAPSIVRHAQISADGKALVTSDGVIPCELTPKIPLNRSYFDASSVAFLSSRAVTVRGTPTSTSFVARTFWPEDFALGGRAPPVRTLPAADTPALRVRALMREAPRGGAQSPYSATTLWQRDAALTDWTGRPILALMVNGAQGDDDEAHAGHFALVTGRIADDGNIGDWLANNYYSLDFESEKGIVAAPVPLDNYLGDLNSGQSWYRPSYLLIAVLRDVRGPALVQSALNRVYNQFYRHQLAYYHPDANCTSISIDALRALGWSIPARGPSSRLLAWLGFPFVALKERSIGKARLAFDYLYTDQTRLMPAAALEEAFTSLWGFAHGATDAGQGELASMLAHDLEALAFIRIPQRPSSRAFGDAPAVTTAEYKSRVPKDPALVQAVPVPPRPFPAEFRDPDLLPPPWHPSDYAAIAWGVLSLVGIPLLLGRAWRSQRRS